MFSLGVVQACRLLFPEPNSRVIFPSLNANTYPMKCKWWDVLAETLHASARQGILPQILWLLMLKPLPWGQCAAADHNRRTSRTSEDNRTTTRRKQTHPFHSYSPKYREGRARACCECNFSWAWMDFSATAKLFWLWMSSSDTKHPLVQYLPSEPP